MFTVILLSHAAQRRFQQWKEIFRPFIDDGRIAVTEWANPSTSHSLAKAAPGLAEAVKGHDEWRLLVVGTGSEGALGEEFADPANPFDFVRNWAAADGEGADPMALDLEDSPYPLVRLTHMVMGYPEMGTKNFFAETSYWDRDERRRIYESEYVGARMQQGLSQKEATEEFLALLPTRHDVQKHYHQDDYTEEEQRRYRELVRKYEVKQAKPHEMVLLAVRDPMAPRPTDELREAWQRGSKANPSRFAERNDYHPSSRFVLFDRPPEDHAAFELGELRFWLSVLTLATNDIPASSFQAERLYRIDVDISPDSLSTTLNMHLGRLTSARDHLENEIRRPKSFTRLDVEEVLRPRTVSVSFEHLSGDELTISTEGYGLASDVPVSESSRWNESFSELEAAAEIFNRKPKRVLAKAVEITRDAPHHFSLPSEPMTEIEKEELEEELSNRIQRLAEATTRDILDTSRLEDILQKQRSGIRVAISERMSSGTILLGSGIVAAVWLATFLPFLIQSLQGGGVAIAESFLVVLIVFGVLATIAVVALVIMRKVLIDRLKAMNKELRNYVNSVKAGASSFGDFLSEIETYMFGKAVMDEQERQARREVRHTKELYENLDVLKSAIAREKSLIKSVGRPIEIRRVSQGTSEFEPWQKDSLSRLLALPVAVGQCEFNSSGEYIDAPFNFIERLTLSSLLLREDPARQRALLDELSDDVIAESEVS